MASVTLRGVQNLFVQKAKDQKILVDEAGYRKKIRDVRPFVNAHVRELVPTPYFVEAIAYVDRAKKLQEASLKNSGRGGKVPNVGDPLMEAIPIYNTVRRRYAGFSNVLEQLWYAKDAPKFGANQDRSFVLSLKPWRMTAKKRPMDWLYICLAHRLTGSGASFEWDHGWRNNRISEMAMLPSIPDMANFLADFGSPIFTSIGNQIPPFPKCGGREYLRTIAPELVMMTWAALQTWHSVRKQPVPIKDAVDMVLRFNKALGCKQFKFVLTAWVMDIAEYMPFHVDPNSDVYHGKNAIEAIEICFEVNMKRQVLYDTATRLFADLSGTYPMDVEDASPGCDLVRWIENYVPKKGFDHVREQGIYNGSSLVWNEGRQPPPF